MPETLDETYQRSLRNINNARWEFALRLLQFVAVASRPLRVKELAELFAFDFKAGSIPRFDEDCRLNNRVDAVLSTCSSLLAIVDDGYSGKFIQFSHFSVKEYLTSPRLAEASDTISRRYHVSMTPAHTLAAQTCLGILLHLDKDVVTKYNLKKWPLAKYAAKHWADHALFEGVSQNVEDGLKQLFDPGKPHLAVCVWINNPRLKPDSGQIVERAERPPSPFGTSLHYAAHWGLHLIVEFLVIECSQYVHSQGFGDYVTPLHLASARGHVKAARMLIELGASVMTRDSFGATPLHLASQEGQVEVARVLIEHGADIAAQDREGCTPLHQVFFNEEVGVEVVRMLIESGADVSAQDQDGSTPLHGACQELERRVEVVRELIESGADVAAQDRFGRTPLHETSVYGGAEIAHMLIERGADVAAQDEDGKTPLHLASRSGHVGVARVLFEHGADVAAQNKEGETPLHQASQSEYVAVARVLLEHGADVAAQDKNGRTPLHLTSPNVLSGADAARMLIERGADVAAQNKNGETPLHMASRSGYVGLARVLFEHGADVAAQNKDRETPLHLASNPNPTYPFQLPGLAEVSRFLLEQGADVNAQNKDGLTPFLLASQSTNAEDTRARVLLQYGADPGDISLGIFDPDLDSEMDFDSD